MKSSEIIKIVEDINYDILQLDEDGKKSYYNFCLEYVYDGCIDYIKFLGKIIWDSDNDERLYKEIYDEYLEDGKIDLKEHIISTMNKRIDKLKQIKKILK